MTNPSDATGIILPKQHASRRIIDDIYTMTKQEKERHVKKGKSFARLQQIEHVIKPLAAMKDTAGGLYHTGMRQEAAEILGVSVITIDLWVARYREDPCIESLLDKKPGRALGRAMSEEQMAIATYFVLNRDLKTLYPNGVSDHIPAIVSPKYIYAIIQKLCPEPTWTIHTLRRFLHDFKADHPLVAMRAQKGEAYLRNMVLPAPSHNVSKPHERWQIDARILPFFVRYKNMICTLSHLQILDDYSWYPVRHRLIPRVMRNDEGVPQKADFTSGDVGILIASAMYHENIRPGELYTDNGSQFIAIEEFLDDLSDENEALICLTNSIPGQPRGRGKIEKFLGLLDELIVLMPANFVGQEKENAFAARTAARAAKNMLTFEDFCPIMDKHIQEVRNRPRNQREKKSRRTIWQGTPALAAPPIRCLNVLTPERFRDYVAVDKSGIEFDKQQYEPLLEDPDDMYRWMMAVITPVQVPLHGAKCDTGWALEACLDGKHWNRCVLQTEQKLNKEQRAQYFNASMRRIRHEHGSTFDSVLEDSRGSGADEVRQHVITGQPVLPDEVPAIIAAEEAQDAQDTSPKPQHGRSPSLTSRKKPQSRPVQQQADEEWPDIDALWDQLGSEER